MRTLVSIAFMQFLSRESQSSRPRGVLSTVLAPPLQPAPHPFAPVFQRLNLHGTGLGDGGIPIWQTQVVTGPMWLKARDTLNRICDLAEAEAVTFTLENLNPLDHPGCPFGSTADVLALVSSIDRPQLKMNLDLYHTQIGEGDLLRWCEKCLPWVGEIQVADNPGRCEPGTGEINYGGVAKGLDKMGYSGPVALESWAAIDPEKALAAFRSAFTL